MSSWECLNMCSFPVPLAETITDEHRACPHTCNVGGENTTSDPPWRGLARRPSYLTGESSSAHEDGLSHTTACVQREQGNRKIRTLRKPETKYSVEQFQAACTALIVRYGASRVSQRTLCTLGNSNIWRSCAGGNLHGSTVLQSISLTDRTRS
jgi:hypothetical protein